MNRSTPIRTLLFTAALCAPLLGAAADTPRSALDGLLAADLAYAKQAAKADLAGGLAPMLADDAYVIVRGANEHGTKAVLEALRKDPDHAAHQSWQPAAGGISADGQQGYTLGYLTLTKADGSTVPFKYLTYWAKRDGTWRAIAFKRGRRGEGDTTLAIPSYVPAKLVPVGDANAAETHRKAVAAAEQAFSDEAQKIGIGPAFARYGTKDSVNMGGPTPTFILGSDKIGAAVGEGEPANGSSVRWSADRAVGASSGDLGLSIGRIVFNEKPTDPKQPAEIPFFTVWYRPSAELPWRYIAE